MTTLDELTERLRNTVVIYTNVITPDGTKIVACWDHGTQKCMVMGDNAQECMRKVVLLEEDLESSK